MVEFRNKYSRDQQILFNPNSIMFFVNDLIVPYYTELLTMKLFGPGRREVRGVLTRCQC